jgi:N-acetylmuramoyl-L-alanine amidase
MRSLFWMLFCLLFAVPAWAQQGYTFRGQAFTPKAASVAGKPVFLLDDPEVKRLVESTAARLQVSSSGKTLYVFLPGRESYWTDNSDVFTRNGQEMKAPGQFFAQPAAMEPAAFWSALGLQAHPTAGGPVRLLAVVTDVAPVTADSLELRILTSAPVKHASSEPQPGTVRLELPDTAWDRSERNLRVGDADIEVQGGDGPDKPTVLLFRYMPFWTAKVKVGFTRELVVSPEPRHFVAPAQQSVLTGVVLPAAPSGMAMRSPDVPNREIRFDLDKPVQFFWALYPRENQLKIEFPATTSSAEGARVMSTSAYKVTRYELSLAAGESFEFFQRDDRPNSLFVRLGPAGQLRPAEPIGTATMAGYAGGAGSIVLDAGHGGGDPGCCNRALGVWEKDVTLDICLRLQQILQKQGWRVEMTRTTDRDVTYAGSPDMMELQARADVANNMPADVFVSIHCNASVSTAVRGSSVYWYKPEDRGLAEYLDVLGQDLGFEHDGLIQNSFAVLRRTNMPAVLVETAFLTNPVEGRLLASPDVRQAIAERLASGLGRYMAEQRRQGVAPRRAQ